MADDWVFNIAKGRWAHLMTLPGAGDGLVAVPLETAGLEAEAVLKDYDDLAALLAGTNNEQVTMGRKVMTTVAVAVDDANERVDGDMDNFVWLAAGGNAISAVIICYDPDVAAGTDADIIPLTKHLTIANPNGQADITVQVPVGGFARAQEPA